MGKTKKAKEKENVIKKKSSINPIEIQIGNFVSKIQSLYESLPLIMIVLIAYHRNEHKKYHDYFKKHGKKIKGSTDKLFKYEDSQILDELNKKVVKTSHGCDMTTINYFVSLVSLFDNFLSNLLKIIFLKLPNSLNNSEKTLTYAEVLKKTSLDDVKKTILEKEIESFCRESHIKQFEILENRFGLSLRKDLPSWSKFVEITERRNLLVHADGIISTQYLKVCEENGYILPKEHIQGVKLDVSKEYFIDSYNIIVEIALKLAFVLWRHLFKDETKTADTFFSNEIAFNLLKNKEYALASNLLDFSHKYFINSDDNSKKSIVINRALSYYLQNNKEKANSILDKVDWSSTNEYYLLGVSIIKEKYDEAVLYMKSLGKNIEKSDYVTWPIYTEFRKNKSFLQTYKQIYKENFLDRNKKPIDHQHKHN